MNREVAIRINGINVQKVKTQPPVKDKNGVPYNLDDPEFPVVKDHEFKINYWAMPRTPAFMLKYLEEHWAYFNRTRFGGRLTKPTIGLLKDLDAMRMRTRGLWTPSERLLQLSPNLFNAPHEGWVNRILIHEMAHQYVTETNDQRTAYEDGRKTKGHGPLWQQAMRMAGLPPSRFDSERNEMYMDKFELKKHKPILDQRARLRELQGTHVINIAPRQFDWVIIPDHGGVTQILMLAAPSSKKRGWWIAATETGTWWKLPPHWLFTPNEDELAFVKNMQTKFTSAAFAVAERAVKEGL